MAEGLCGRLELLFGDGEAPAVRYHARDLAGRKNKLRGERFAREVAFDVEGFSFACGELGEQFGFFDGLLECGFAVQLNWRIAARFFSTRRWMRHWDWPGSEREFRRAIDLQPNYPTAHHWYSHYLAAVGLVDDGLAEIRRAHQLDPFEVNIDDWLGTILYDAGRHDEAIT